MQPCFFWVLKKAGDTQLSKLGIHCLASPSSAHAAVSFSDSENYVKRQIVERFPHRKFLSVSA